MQLLPPEMQELLRIKSAGLLTAFIPRADSVFFRREATVRHVP